MVYLLRPYLVRALELANEHPSVRRVETQSFPQDRTQILDRRGILHELFLYFGVGFGSSMVFLLVRPNSQYPHQSNLDRPTHSHVTIRLRVE